MKTELTEQYKKHFFEGMATPEEEKWLKENSQDPFFVAIRARKEEKMDWSFEEFQTQIQPKIQRKSFKKIYTIAAGFALLLSIGAYLLFQQSDSETPNKTIAHQSISKSVIKKTKTIQPKIIAQKPEINYTSVSSSVGKSSVIASVKKTKRTAEKPETETPKASWQKDLNDPYSSTTRLAAVLKAGEQKDLSATDIELLTHVLNQDENTNVRLAALKVLSGQKNRSQVQTEILHSIDQQDDPIVQIQMLSGLSPKEATVLKTKLLTIADDPNSIKPVRDEAYAALLKSNSNF